MIDKDTLDKRKEQPDMKKIINVPDIKKTKENIKKINRELEEFKKGIK